LLSIDKDNKAARQSFQGLQRLFTAIGADRDQLAALNPFYNKIVQLLKAE
jgi:hypothetical protein